MSIIVFALAAAVTLPLAARQQGPGAEAQLQAAINEETVEGDLKTAIEMSRKLADAGSDRAVAVKALLRMGECYEKLGDAESRKAYERIVAQFPDQKDAVLEAHKRLATKASGTGPEAGLIERRVWSPDGKRLVYNRFQDSKRTLVVRTMETGEDQELPEPTSWVAGWFPDGQSLLAGKTRIDVKTGHAEPVAGLERVSSFNPGTYVALSHDGKTFYYSVNDNDAAKNNGLFTVHLIRRRIDTGEEKDLYQGKPSLPNGLHCITVSPDDRQVAFGETRETVVVKVVAAEGGVARELFAKSAWGVVWSKDGKYLLVRALSADGKFQLLSVPVDGGPARPIALNAQEIRLALHPDGRRLAFVNGSYTSELTAIRNLFPEPNATR